jgi:ATP-dependent RNA helicase DDX21
MKFERVGVPQPQDIAKIAAERTVEAIRGVDDSVVPYFTEAAQKLLDGNAEVSGLWQFAPRAVM